MNGIDNYPRRKTSEKLKNRVYNAFHGQDRHRPVRTPPASIAPPSPVVAAQRAPTPPVAERPALATDEFARLDTPYRFAILGPNGNPIPGFPRGAQIAVYRDSTTVPKPPVEDLESIGRLTNNLLGLKQASFKIHFGGVVPGMEAIKANARFQQGATGYDAIDDLANDTTNHDDTHAFWSEMAKHKVKFSYEYGDDHRHPLNAIQNLSRKCEEDVAVMMRSMSQGIPAFLQSAITFGRADIVTRARASLPVDRQASFVNDAIFGAVHEAIKYYSLEALPVGFPKGDVPRKCAELLAWHIEKLYMGSTDELKHGLDSMLALIKQQPFDLRNPIIDPDYLGRRMGITIGVFVAGALLANSHVKKHDEEKKEHIEKFTESAANILVAAFPASALPLAIAGEGLKFAVSKMTKVRDFQTQIQKLRGNLKEDIARASGYSYSEGMNLTTALDWIDIVIQECGHA